MEEIRIYHIQWKMWVLILECIAFIAMGCFLLQDNDINRVFVWIGISFSGICGLFILYLLIREKTANIPYYLITDKSIVMNSGGKKTEIAFADVESFSLKRVGSAKMIGISYKNDIEIRKKEESKYGERLVRDFNVKIAGVQEVLPAYDLSMKPEQLCDLLNERLRTS